MITVYFSQPDVFSTTIDANNRHLLPKGLWIDLLNPTTTEKDWVEEVLEISLPTKKEMREIELSSRLYKENEALFMTVSMVEKSDSDHPKNDAVTLVLLPEKFISIRYIEPHSFALFTSRLSKIKMPHTITDLFIGFLDAAIDRLADILENVSHTLDKYSQKIFRPLAHEHDHKTPNHKLRLQQVGACGDLNAKVQESLINFSRLISFYEQNNNLSDVVLHRLSVMNKDINSLNESVNFLSNKVNFLLDATLGLVNIEQNNIIKIFSIAAVILLPPTLIATVYGMNFKNIPELSWYFGYPFAILIMIISAILPYKYFKKKKWID